MPAISIRSSVWSELCELCQGWSRRSSNPSEPGITANDDQAERDFVNETIWSRPDAFSSELDIQNMMSVFPGRF